MFRHRENEVIQKDPVRTLGECNGYNGDADIASALHVVNKIVAGLVTEKWMEAVGYWSRSAELLVPRSCGFLGTWGCAAGLWLAGFRL